MTIRRVVPNAVATGLGFAGGLLTGLTGNLLYLAAGGLIAYEAYKLMDSKQDSRQYQDEDSDLFI